MRVLLKAALLSALLSGSVLAQVAAVELPLAPLAPEDPGAVVTSEYQSDAARLLRVVGSALYHDKSAFLRELISNAADALEKYRVISLTEGLGDVSEHQPLNVTIRPIREDGRLVITDSGIGMTREELQNNLGTIARSGTSEFLSKISNSATTAEQASGLIGKFGLGFYSSFLVSNKVVVASKSFKEDEQWVFESASAANDAEGSQFKIYRDPRGTTLGSRGTEITLYLNDEAKEYLDSYTLKGLVQQHAEFSTGDAPIYVWTEEVTSEAQEPDSADDGIDESDRDEASSQKDKVAVFKKYWKRINDQPPIWMRDPKSLTEQEYKGFFKATFKEDASVEPLYWSHFSGDAGSTSFRALMYLPGQFPHDFYSKSYQVLNSLRLYVRRVFITNDLGPDFLPKWLNWLKVVVDADDLPLNVGRDSLQNNKGVVQIKRTIARKAVDMLGSAAKADLANYHEKIWPIVGTALKLGALEDYKNQAKLLKLLRFHSSSSSGETTSLDEYIAKRKQGQTQIYYIAGAGMERKDLEKSPFVENIQARGYEVLYFTEPLDEMIASQVREYDGLTFQDVAKKGLKYGDEDDEASKADKEVAYKPLADFLKAKLGEFVKEVVLSTRLTTSPCAIVADQGAWTANMERLMAAQNNRGGIGPQEEMMRSFMKMQKKIMEINPDHPLIEGLLDKIHEFGEDQESALKDDDLDELVEILYDTSLVRSGFNVRDPTSYFGKVESILRRSLGVSESAKARVEVKPAPPVEEGPVRSRQDQQPEVGDDPAAGTQWTDWAEMKEKLGAAKVESTRGEQAEEIDLTHQHDEL